MIVVWYDCISLLVTVYALTLCTRQHVLVTSHILWCPASFAPPNLYLLPPTIPSFCSRLLLWYHLVIVRMNNLSSSHHQRSVQSLWLAHTNVFDWHIQMWLTGPYKCVWVAHTNVFDWPIQMALTPTSYNLLVPNPLILLEINQPS